MRRMKLAEFAFEPKPLSGMAQNAPPPAGSSAENPPTGCVASGAGAGAVFGTPGHGAGQVASAGRIARPCSTGSPDSWAAADGAAARPRAMAASAVAAGDPSFIERTFRAEGTRRTLPAARG